MAFFKTEGFAKEQRMPFTESSLSVD